MSPVDVITLFGALWLLVALLMVVLFLWAFAREERRGRARRLAGDDDQSAENVIRVRFTGNRGRAA